MSRLYLYGLTSAKRVPDRLVANGIALVGDGDRAAIVSDVGDSPIDATRRNLLAHADVVEELHRDAVVLPVRFGTIVQDRSGVLELLRLRQVDALFARHADSCELTVKGTYDEAVLADAAVQVGGLLDAYRAAPTVDAGIALGEAVSGALARRRERDAEIVVGRLRSHSQEIVIGEPTGELGAFSFALLVRRGEVDAVSRALEELAAQLSPPLRFKLVGPLPPYSFVDIQLPVAA